MKVISACAYLLILSQAAVGQSIDIDPRSWDPSELSVAQVELLLASTKATLLDGNFDESTRRSLHTVKDDLEKRLWMAHWEEGDNGVRPDALEATAAADRFPDVGWLSGYWCHTGDSRPSALFEITPSGQIFFSTNDAVSRARRVVHVDDRILDLWLVYWSVCRSIDRIDHECFWFGLTRMRRDGQDAFTILYHDGPGFKKVVEEAELDDEVRRQSATFDVARYVKKPPSYGRCTGGPSRSPASPIGDHEFGWIDGTWCDQDGGQVYTIDFKGPGELIVYDGGEPVLRGILPAAGGDGYDVWELLYIDQRGWTVRVERIVKQSDDRFAVVHESEFGIAATEPRPVDLVRARSAKIGEAQYLAHPKVRHRCD